MPTLAAEKTLSDLFRRAGPPPGDTARIGPFRVGDTYRYRLHNGCKRKFRVIRIYLPGVARYCAELLIEYIDTGTRGYVTVKNMLKSLVHN
jgi:hypothetical protein